MKTHSRRKHLSHQRVLVVADQHGPFYDGKAGGKKNHAKLGTAVDTEATNISDQESSRSQQQQAADRADQARRILTRGLRHVSTVSTRMPDDSTPMFEGARPSNDVQLIARVDAVIAATTAHADAFANEGVEPALLATLTSELAAFKKAKETITLSGKQYTEATAALDQALSDGDNAIAVLEGLLATSPDAPVGALTAFQQAKLIGPREIANATIAAPTPAPTPAPAVSPAPDVSNKAA